MASESKPPISFSVLEKYFPVVKDLRDYLSEIIELDNDGGDSHSFLPRVTDSTAYRDLIDTSYVASKSPDAQNPKARFKAYQPTMYMREIIDKAQELLFKRAKGKPQNLITSGYRLASRNGERGKTDMSRIGITNYFVNTIITALQAPEWETLLQRIGIDAMYHLLTDMSIFISLPNDNLCQLTGDPILYAGLPDRQLNRVQKKSDAQKEASAKRTATGSHEDEPPKKKLRRCDSALSRSNSSIANGGNTQTTAPSYSPADITLVRARLFYSRPIRVPHTNLLAVGLPPRHILNVLNPSFQKKPKVAPEDYVDPDPKKQAADSRHLSKYVFPRQYQLSSPFNPGNVPRGFAFKFPDYTDREDEIKAKGACKTPKRLKSILPILEKLIWRHGKCGYKPLRDKVCPSKIKNNGEKQLDSSIILELMSEPSYPRSQPSMADISVDSAGCPISQRGLSQARNQVKHKPKFAEFACSYASISRYVVVVTNSVIPKIVWGSVRNFKHIIRHVDALIACRRFETLSLHNILQGFSTSDCDWLMPTGRRARKQTRVSVTDSLKRRELLEEFLYWYFDSFVLPLLKTTFYITESSAFRNQVLYFRQDDWEILCAPLVDRLTSGTFEKLILCEAEEVLRQRKLGFSFVRLLPKDTGVRPIVNLGRRKTAKKGFYSPPEQSINQILQAAFRILTYEKNAQPTHIGASVFGHNEVYNKLKGLKARLPRDAQGNLPKLYFVKLDVQACFDTIEQTKLLEILRELISEDVYMMHRHGQVTSVTGKIKRIYVKQAVPEEDHPHFLKYAAELADTLRHTIFVDQVVYPYLKKQDILQLLEEHITENIVKIGQDYYRQMVGIPQGSVLSTLLCSFFYGDLEKRFTKFSEDPKSVLLRLVDDYLYVSTSLEKARSFLNMMMQGHPEYGCFISKEKTMANFDFDIEIMNVTEPHQRHFPWCGYLIDMENLSVSVDYSRYQGTSVNDSLTVDRSRRPGASFANKMLQMAKAKSHIIYCDAEFNTDHVVYFNIYQNFMLSAMKMHAYLRTWNLDVAKSSKFIRGTIRQMILYTYATIRSNASSKMARDNAGRCDVQKEAVNWLGTHAFHTVLSQKPPKYASLLKSLAFELSLPRHRKSRKRFRKVVKEGAAGMAQISF